MSLWAVHQGPLDSYDETLIECCDCEKTLPRYKFGRNKTSDGDRRCIQCTQLHNTRMAGVFWALNEGEPIPEISRGMYSIMCGNHASSLIMESIDFGIKPAKEHLVRPDDEFEFRVGSLEEEVLAQLDGKHWTDRPAPWNFEVDAVAQEGILEQLARFSRERKLKTLGLPDEPKAKASQPQDVQVEDASLFWCDPNSFQSDVNQEWQSADPWKSKLVQTSNLPWGLASTNKLWFPPALKHVRPSTIKAAPVLPEAYRD